MLFRSKTGSHSFIQQNIYCIPHTHGNTNSGDTAMIKSNSLSSHELISWWGAGQIVKKNLHTHIYMHTVILISTMKKHKTTIFYFISIILFKKLFIV